MADSHRTAILKAWARVVLLGTFGKLLAKLTAPIAVLFCDRKENPIWGVRDATDFGWWNCAIRNGAHNLFDRPQVPHFTKTRSDDHTLEREEGLQTRFRWSYDKVYVSYRVTWGKPRNKGKKEFYIGWTMNETPRMRLTFFQLRPF